METIKYWFSYIRRAKFALSGALIVFVATLFVAYTIARIYNVAQARTLMEAVIPSVRTLSFAVITSASTIIALLMTMLGFANRVDTDFSDIFYMRVRMIAVLGAVGLVSATLVLLVLSVPITEADDMHKWYRAAYGMIVVGSAWIASLLVAIIIILYQALVGLIDIFTPDKAV